MSFKALRDSAWDFDPLDNSSILSHRDKLIELRQAACHFPLGQDTPFQVYIHRHDANVQTGMRPLPAFAHTSALRTLTLETPLQTKPDTWSQSYEPPRLLATSEDYIYRRRFSATQGSAVPYYFGLHDVTMPNGENAYLLAMEYVEGVTVAQWRDNLPDLGCSDDPETTSGSLPDRIAALQNILVLTLRSMKAMHNANVLHLDARGANMIIHPSIEAPTHVVMIDFGMSEASTNNHSQVVERKRCIDAVSCCAQHGTVLDV
ncbi:hypothetical protein BV25DRAFT_1842314 [Artomyces pyxidatus]|uniref:Uncharacterized protein n=1 Tax=Artomyces pyxidatus TaxID=48021 RepID=A0ACB8SJU2_9AGAM|nr:hypothetical protein BV25DRAFT_1842314 [Artomyces pyxidatus]